MQIHSKYEGMMQTIHYPKALPEYLATTRLLLGQIICAKELGQMEPFLFVGKQVLSWNVPNMAVNRTFLHNKTRTKSSPIAIFLKLHL